MEAVAVGVRRGPSSYLARLRLDRATVETRFGLRFETVDDDLGPAALALIRLAGGDLIGFGRLQYDAEPGVEVVHYTARPPREVVAELLAESGLTHQDLSWMSGGLPGAEFEPVARSVTEAILYLTGDPDGEVRITTDRTEVRRGERTVLVDPASDGLLDAAQWQEHSRRCAGRAAEMLRVFGERRPTAAEHERARHLLECAVDCAAEVARLVPAGTGQVPVRHLWTADGLQALRQRAADFGVPRIDRELARRRLDLAEFVAVFGPPPVDRTAPMNPPLARSGSDASMFLDFQECRCGGKLLSFGERSLPAGDHEVLTVKARCVRRVWHRFRFRFTVRPGTLGTARWQMSLRGEPSHLVDPGQWLVMATVYAAGDQQAHAMNMKLAASSVEEAMLFVPPGADAVPEEEIRSRHGQEMLAVEPDRFRWPWLLAARDDYLAASGPEDPGPELHPLPARGVTEALMFMDLHRCECGTAEFHRQVQERGGDPARLTLRYHGVCLACRRERAFVFTVPRDDPDPDPLGYGLSMPGDGPSALLDAGQLWMIGEMNAERANQLEHAAAGDWDDDSWEAMLAALATSVAVYDELLALLPPGAGAIPDGEFRTPAGRSRLRYLPESFARGHLSAERARRRHRLDEFLATVPEPD
ncbi:hypothetical protein KZ829_38405 [Actinoplanes hulinensis]|uniref:Uncharacterized protein n=1 Tax=Actinoplanes hulinensis TaxID=1144547 RepID=A0ABS7BFE7_9ACTN|nr:hypothetical protein [Actinoplanes hulinensis]MBW6439616.1 hypothetical protein [Actinoplanes hulinensis]